MRDESFIADVLAFADTLEDDQRIVALSEPFTWAEFEREEEERPIERAGMKPVGLWYACGGEWLRWLTSEWPARLAQAPYIYELFVDVSSMLVLPTSEDVVAFDREYSVPGALRESRGEAIDWARVAREYGGVEICPYHWELRYDLLWYYTWDVASGCIWSNRTLCDFKLIAQLGDEAVQPTRSPRSPSRE